MMMNNGKIIVVGCGRSGTLYMSKVLKAIGFDVGHERTGADGISSWFHSFGNRQKRLLQNDFKGCERFIIHLVRHPVDVIYSMVRASKSNSRYALGYFKDICPDETNGYEDFELGMLYWWFWNSMTEKRGVPINMRIRVEDIYDPYIDKGLGYLCWELGVDLTEEIIENVQKLGTRTHILDPEEREKIELEYPELKSRISFLDMLKLNEKLARKVGDLATEYGYKMYE